MRAKLFLSVGSIILLFAILSYLIPKYYVRKDVDATAVRMHTLFTNYQQRVENLTPESFLQALMRLLGQLHDSLITKLSFNLLAIAFLLLCGALLVLARISKKITQPITLLAQASEQIGNGHYEGLHLPPVKQKQHDEVTVLTHSFEKMVVSLQEREKIRGVLNKVVSKEIASQVLKGSVELGGEERTLTLLFSDIRDFTPLSQTLSAQALIGLLNAYMTRMCRIIDATHGVVDKFVGDEIMALYGAPLDLENHAEKAIRAALEMLYDLKKWNQTRKDTLPHFSIGIGIHTGIAFAGNMGAENRLNYTVVGSTVNLAARLCSAAHPYQILVSEATYLALPDPHQFPFQPLPPMRLKGIDSPVAVYGLIILG
jgi:adenylate cyclase